MAKKSSKVAPKKVARKKVVVHDNTTNTHTKKSTIPQSALPKVIDAEMIYEGFRGAKINTERQQPKKLTDVLIDVVGEDGETHTHLVDMRQCPQEIIESWEGELA